MHTMRLASGRVILHNGDFSGDIRINASGAEVETLKYGETGVTELYRVTLPFEEVIETVRNAAEVDHEQAMALLATGLRALFTDHALGLIAIEARTKGPAAGSFWQDLAAACERAASV